MIERKLLAVGDLHTKFHILDRVIEKSEDYDRVIFLGDYVDEWNVCPEASYNLLSRLIEFKKANMDKVVLCLGNHCLSEWQGGIFRCSGYNEITHQLVKELYDRNENLFCAAHAEEDILFSHAGLTNGWCKDNKLDTKQDAKSLSDALNGALKNRMINNMSKQLFNALATAGGARGGIHSPSPLWADYTELIANSVPHLNQVVGHTPTRTIEHHIVTDGDGSKHTLFFCDTHSLYRTGENIGDNTLLEIATFTDDIPLYTTVPL